MTVPLLYEPRMLAPAFVSAQLPAAEPERSGIWRGSEAPQRATVRALRDRLGDNPDAICLAYVAAE